MIQPVMQRIPLPQDTRDALAEKGVQNIPEAVILHVQEATGREGEHWKQRQEVGFATDAEMKDWLASLVMRRAAEGTDPVVVRELVNDLRPTQISQFFMAYLHGEAGEDPKVLEQMAQAVKNTTLMTALPVLETLALAGRSLSLLTTTASTPETPAT